MIETQVRDTLADVRAQVPVPVLDEVALAARVRGARRVRRGRRAVGAVLVAAVLAAAAAPGATLLPAGSRAPGPAAPVPAPLPASTPVTRAALVLEGQLTVLLPDESSYAPGLPAAAVLGSGPAGVVALTPSGRVAVSRLAATGQPGPLRALTDGHVRDAVLDANGEVLTFVDDGGDVHQRLVGSRADVGASGLHLAADERLLAGDLGRVVVVRGAAATLRTPTGIVPLPTSGAAAVSAQLRGDVVAVRVPGATELVTAAGSRLRAVAALSPDGRRLAVATGTGSWAFVDVATGGGAALDGVPSGARAIAMTWQDPDHVLVVGTDRHRPGNHVLLDCSVTRRACTERFDDPTGTLELARR
jgi:hypothetical protein